MVTGKILWEFVVDKLGEITAIIKNHVKRHAICEDEGLENRIKQTMKNKTWSDIEWCTSEFFPGNWAAIRRIFIAILLNPNRPNSKRVPTIINRIAIPHYNE